MLDVRMPLIESEPAVHGLVDARQAFHQLAVEGAGALVEGAGEFGDADVEGRVDLADRGLETIFEQARAQVEVDDCVVCTGLEALAEMPAALFERGVEA